MLSFQSTLRQVVSLLAIVCWCGVSLAGECVIPYTGKAGGPRLWPAEVPEGCPFERSRSLGGVCFTGRHAEYTNADTWYPSWAADGNLYSPWTDGSIDGFVAISDENALASSGEVAQTGRARITGDDPLHLQVVNLGRVSATAKPYGGRYPCGGLVYQGIWYQGTYTLDNVPEPGYNWGVLGPFVGFHISRDYGQTWQDPPCIPERPLFGETGKDGGKVKIGAPHFVDFGRELEHSPDGKAYLIGHGAVDSDPQPRIANLSWITGDQVYLCRVKPAPETMNDPNQYEFFAGHDSDGKPVWTHNFAEIKPLVEWNNRCGCVTMTWNPGLRKYLMCVTDGWPTVKTYRTWILESDEITGPFRLVTFMQDFGKQAYFVNIPSKFISPDGRTAWLCYSANFTGNIQPNPPGSRYGMCLQEIVFPDPADADRIAQAQREDPLYNSQNLALKAQTGATSAFPFSPVTAAIDGVVGGYPETPQYEWAAQSDRNLAALRLSWNEPVEINRIWLFDRPNTTFDQVMSGLLVFSDGTTLPVGALPDDGKSALEVSFPVKKVEWLFFVVTAVKPETKYTGLAEIAVFGPDRISH